MPEFNGASGVVEPVCVNGREAVRRSSSVCHPAVCPRLARQESNIKSALTLPFQRIVGSSSSEKAGSQYGYG
ncbi:hypothetical protein CORC01_00710 [Colletotrichum orchidophilum]|uniref:Uncharacterized protein n=1 Tax=Colletotrichum orchidophilum TaxID=1209926 RepID=A0A1G4BR63_9PEZI|nr:uncharacterized protein CORC01_00710 [Colletotrichum orchidophilum]OHF03848.1 hypothetical protein CORC01_00710 [Colletotrichum orchidophilum]